MCLSEFFLVSCFSSKILKFTNLCNFWNPGLGSTCFWRRHSSLYLQNQAQISAKKSVLCFSRSSVKPIRHIGNVLVPRPSEAWHSIEDTGRENTATSWWPAQGSLGIPFGACALLFPAIHEGNFAQLQAISFDDNTPDQWRMTESKT